VSLRSYLLDVVVAASMGAAPALAADQQVLPFLPPPLLTKAGPPADLEYFMPSPVPAFLTEFAARYWYGNGKTSKNLYNLPSVSNAMISRLTYGGLTTNSGELYGRVAFTGGWFVKGYFGFGGVSGGSLRDEDFPPGISPYSSTLSDQHGGSLDYASGDFGGDFVRGGDFHLGAFAGYHYFHEALNAYGCTQTATNPNVCQPAISSAVEVISQNNNWQSLRVGLEGAVKFADRFTLTAEGAWLPYVFLNGADSHWLRIGTASGDFTGPINEDGSGQGYQLEALLSYQVTQYASVGLGGRYWHMQTNGNAHESFVGGTTFTLPEQWKTDIYGVFIQASLKLGPYPVALH